MKTIDPRTGKPPVMERGTSIAFTLDIVEGYIVPDGITDDGEPIVHVEVHSWVNNED